MVVVATVRVMVPPSKRREVLQALRALRGPTEARAECLGHRVYQSADDENTLLLVQEWATETALHAYLQSDLYRTILAVVETASERPEVRFDCIDHRAGMEIVEAARDHLQGSR